MSALVDRVRGNDNNREPRQPLVLLVDTSSSMADDLPDVAAGLDGLRSALARDPVARNRVELVVITFGGRVTTHGDFGEAALFEPPPLSAFGDTPMAAALTQGLDLLVAKKQAYRRSGLDCYRPLLFLLTDGEPTDMSRWPEAVRRVREAERDRKLVLLAVRTKTAGFARLGELSPGRVPLRLKERRCSSGSAGASRRAAARGRARRCHSRTRPGRAGGERCRREHVAGRRRVGARPGARTRGLARPGCMGPRAARRARGVPVSVRRRWLGARRPTRSSAPGW